MTISKRKYNSLKEELRTTKELLEESREYIHNCDDLVNTIFEHNNKLASSLFDLRKEYKDKIKLKNKKIKSRKEQIEYLKSKYNEFNFKILDISRQLELVEDAEMNEYNFVKLIDNIQNIVQGSDNK